MMTQEEAEELLEALREDRSEIPQVDARKLTGAYVAIMDSSPKWSQLRCG